MNSGRSWKYIKPNDPVEVVVYKLVGALGVISSLANCILYAAMDYPIPAIVLLIAAVGSAVIIFYIDKSGKYVMGYFVTTLTIFMGLFAILFVTTGANTGYFFIMGLSLTFMLFNGKKMVVIGSITAFFYLTVYIYIYYHPNLVQFQLTESTNFLSLVIGTFGVSIVICTGFRLYVKAYRQQQRELEKANFEALAASRAKTRFLANISHEVRTPINMMLGMNEMIQRESDRADIKEYAENVGKAGKQLMFIVNEMLEYARLEEDHDEVIEAPYNLEVLAKNLAAYYSREAGDKHLRFEYIFDRNIVPTLVGDERKITQILTNLLSNAVKYTSSGNICLAVRRLEINDNLETLYFEVADTGVGIEEKEFENIFKSFERAEIKKNYNIEGTGLGLAISQTLAKMMGTTIEVSSKYGLGSRFGFKLVQKIISEEELEGREKLVESFTAPDAKILVVDDNIINLKVVSALLKRTGVQLDTASGALECMEKLEKKNYNIILMDIMMPDIDGFEALKMIRASEEHKKQIVVALTAQIDGEAGKKIVEAGFDAMLGKPLDWRELERCLVEYIPENMIVRSGIEKKKVLPKESFERFSKLLEPYDINLAEGLRTFDGDFEQYVKVAGYFVKNYKVQLAKLDATLPNVNESLVGILHSLKNNAANVGATELFKLLKLMEMRGRNGDSDYVLRGIQLVRLELERAYLGLTTLVEHQNHASATDIKDDEVTKDFEELIDKLLSHLAECEQKPALKIAAQLYNIAQEQGMSELTIQRVGEARDLIENIEFDLANEVVLRLKEDL